LVQIVQFDLQGEKKISPFNPEFLFKHLGYLGCVLEIKSSIQYEISKFWSRKRAKKNQGKQRNQNFTKESEKIVIRKLGYRKDSDSKTGVQKR